MKVILINGSPNKEGCTFTALSIVEEELNAAGIETQMFQLGREAIAGCRDCRHCFEHGACAIGDIVNAFTALAEKADGFVFGSPVHYAAAGGGITAFMDRVFFSARRREFRGKPAAAVVSCRRGGSTAALDQLNKYFSTGT